MIRLLLAVVVLALAVGALPGREASDGDDDIAVPTATPHPPALPRAALDRQDRVDAAHRIRESRAFDERPLLSALPLTVDGVRFDIAGLERAGRTVLLRVSPGTHDRAVARALYRRILAAHRDAGTHYRLRWER